MVKTKRAMYESMVTKVKALSPMYQIKAIATEVFSKTDLNELKDEKEKQILAMKPEMEISKADSLSI